MHRRTERLLWASAVLATGAAGVTAVGGGQPQDLQVSPVPELARPIPPADRLELARSAARVAASNPFRFTRRPADRELIEAHERLLAAPEYLSYDEAPRFLLEFAGVTGGPPWAALIDGLPGRERSVLFRTGDTIGELVALRITRDTVVLAGADTTYVLTARTPWP